ncbi:MAG TPA: hypothetical protein PLN13_09305 [Bacteroidia bacterium]|nr:hypothetical protein [Bacteroidia bacterium]HRH08765.1 hypothetical protein [Bacteroidia bacterium]
MSPRLLELHFSQLAKAWNKSQYNNYSDNNKKLYHNKLGDLYRLLKTEDFSRFSQQEIMERYDVINMIFKSLEFLDSSTLNLLPFEIVTCLDCALRDWLQGDEELIIVTSLVNDINNYSFDESLATNEQLFKYVELQYGVKFASRLIQINLPATLSRDYLANVVLYHELGHFIDTKYQISRAIHDEILEKLFVKRKITPEEEKELADYFPFLENYLALEPYYNNQGEIKVLRYYLAEYFCDLFASQYIKTCSSHYLQYLTQAYASQHSNSHPSTKKRVELTEKFLSGDDSTFTLSKIKEAVNKTTAGKSLSVKFEEKKSNDFIKLVPIDIENDSQLHYLFVHGWDLWLNNWHLFEEQNEMKFKLDREKVYDIVNSLIEKSIGNYVVKTNWDKAKANVSK